MPQPEQQAPAFVAIVPGAQLGPWRLDEELGRGAMGIVFLAWNEDAQPVALKVLRDPTRGQLVQRFLRETHALGRLDHPNIVKLVDSGQEGELPWYAMDLVEGTSLEELLLDGSVGLERRIELIAAVARGVAHAHAAGVIHRDLKPANVLVSSEGVPKVLDFGLARLQDDDGSNLTRTGATIGTPRYMSPEQVASKPVGPAGDVWALGVMLYDAIAGRLPFQARDAPTLFKEILEHRPAPPGDDPELAATVLRALEKDPAARHATALELARELEGWLARRRGESRRPSARLVPVQAPPVKKPAATGLGYGTWAVIAAIALALLGTAPLIWRGSRLPAQAPPGAEGPQRGNG